MPKYSVFKPIKAGFMRDRITIQTPQITQPDGGGGGIYGWSDVAQVWAQVKTANASFNYRSENFLQEGQMMEDHYFSMIIRYNKPLTTAMRVLLRGQGLQIRFINNINILNWTVQLLCQEEGLGEPQY